VAENRRRYLLQLEADPAKLVTVGQVHGAEVAIATGAGFHPERDAVVTATPGLVLAVSGADCLPILFFARGARGAGVGAAHAGWRGTVAGVVGATLRSLCRLLEAEPDHVQVHFGPCIRDCCYEVGPEVAARFAPEALRRSGESCFLDIPRAARAQLLGAGVPAESIEDTGACTACEPHWYFSHRRDRGLTGRHWGAIGLRSEPA
jgi:YfiH family protein